MSEPSQGAPAKPRLKLNVSRSGSFVTDPAASTPAVATPSGDGTRKVKLKVTSSQPPTPAAVAAPVAQPDLPPPPPPAKTKAGRQPKPTQKLVDSKKRPHEDDDDDDDEDDDDDAPMAHHASTRIKIRHTPKSTPRGGPTQLVVRPRGRAPPRPPGDGYDSEASDRELDPHIEEQIVLRMLPGEHCDYIRWCMENGKMGIPRASGGADIQMKFFEEETRRAMITVKGQPYAAVLVDLPTITEAMKSWDRKNFLKSADICQMIYVYAPVANEEEARTRALPALVTEQKFKWPHGLTPPMHDCVHRRFAKMVSREQIEDKEAYVSRLMAEDAKAKKISYEYVDVDDLVSGDEDEDEDMDAEGEVDDSMGYFNQPMDGVFGDDDDDGDLEADLEAAFANEDLAADTPATGAEGITPMPATQIDTPGSAMGPHAVQQSIEDGESEEDADDDDDDDDEDDEDMDDDERAERDELEGVKDIIADMNKQLAAKQADLEKQTNAILRQRLQKQIGQLKSEIELKMSSIGMEADE
ncbi:transcription initiation factor tfiid 55 kd subunit [Emericellopsis atlantica]|uniref:Transcription initiation factor tfiid 55 kd subunit n=1 Tax=Emericellopsis atlantica TaxID=2614577 RepID=A0A9P7ZDE5_9HYPO|nr:transcription initiation factor tfiid 55 kd subunit [Emericellopsis atlantica]KAG9249866.1 transcription initiation factor tfiid 55 kd subunit [Emericellopsis atlantica]